MESREQNQFLKFQYYFHRLNIISKIIRIIEDRTKY